MKKTYIYILIALGLSFTTVSCSDFLSEDSREDLAEEDQEVIEVQKFLTAAYGQFDLWDYGFSYLGITEIISDNSDKGSSSTDPGGDKQILDELTYTPSAGSFGSMWKNWYKSIGKSTQSMQKTEQSIEKAKQEAIESGEQLNIENQNLKVRYLGEAHFLRGLNYFFLVRGWGDVPIQEYDSIKRVDADSVYNYLIKDLKYAELNLPVVSKYGSTDLGRATQGAAQGLLSKVYLYRKDYQNSYDYANKVINSGQYGLFTNYSDNWKSENHNGKESIFEFQAVSATSGNVAKGIQQYSVTQGARGGSNGWGWGFNTPSDNLLNDFNNSGDFVRRDATIIFRNGTLYDGRIIGNTENARYNYKAYTPNSPGADQNDRSIMYMRYSEVLLIKAESANELGLTAEALDALNTVRNRVNLPNITETDKTKLREIIWHERRLELAMEHDRWFDLIRTRQAESVMKALGKPFTNKNWLFPIPNDQISVTPEMPQNTDW